MESFFLRKCCTAILCLVLSSSSHQVASARNFTYLLFRAGALRPILYTKHYLFRFHAYLTYRTQIQYSITKMLGNETQVLRPPPKIFHRCWLLNSLTENIDSFCFRRWNEKIHIKDSITEVDFFYSSAVNILLLYYIFVNKTQMIWKNL